MATSKDYCTCLQYNQCHRCGKRAWITASLHNWCREHFDEVILDKRPDGTAQVVGLSDGSVMIMQADASKSVILH